MLERVLGRATDTHTLAIVHSHSLPVCAKARLFAQISDSDRMSTRASLPARLPCSLRVSARLPCSLRVSSRPSTIIIVVVVVLVLVRVLVVINTNNIKAFTTQVTPSTTPNSAP